MDRPFVMGFFAEFRQLANHLDFRPMMANATSTAKPYREKTQTNGLSFDHSPLIMTELCVPLCAKAFQSRPPFKS